jgi:hypothetical protein
MTELILKSIRRIGPFTFQSKKDLEKAYHKEVETFNKNCDRYEQNIKDYVAMESNSKAA